MFILCVKLEKYTIEQNLDRSKRGIKNKEYGVIRI